MEALAHPAQSENFERVYRRCKQRMLRQARSWFPALRGRELDLYHSAWESVLRNAHAIEDVEVYLETALYTQGLFELRTGRRRYAASLDTAGSRAPGERTELLPEEELETRADARFLAEVLERLTPIQQTVVTMRWGWGLSRKEAAAALSISERTVKRTLEEAVAVISEGVELIEAGRWCETKRSLILAFSFELLSPRRAAKAERHLEVCPGCKQTALAIRHRLEGVAAVAPAPLLSRVPSDDGLLANALQFAEAVRHALGDILAGAKHQLVALLTRTPAAEAATQTAAAGGLRGSGGVVAALAACVLAGGGATYCAIEGVPDSFRGLALIEKPHKMERKHTISRPKHQQTTVVQPAPPASPDTPTDNTTQNASDGTAGPATSAEQVPASPAPAGSEEFGPAPEASAAAKPAPAPTSGGGEFTP